VSLSAESHLDAIPELPFISVMKVGFWSEADSGAVWAPQVGSRQLKTNSFHLE
jgi:hypothetical protein